MLGSERNVKTIALLIVSTRQDLIAILIIATEEAAHVSVSFLLFLLLLLLFLVFLLVLLLAFISRSGTTGGGSGGGTSRGGGASQDIIKVAALEHPLEETGVISRHSDVGSLEEAVQLAGLEKANKKEY